jgi:hypothetical protein
MIESHAVNDRENSAEKLGVLDIVRRKIKILKSLIFGSYERLEITTDGTNFVFNSYNVAGVKKKIGKLTPDGEFYLLGGIHLGGRGL